MHLIFTYFICNVNPIKIIYLLLHFQFLLLNNLLMYLRDLFSIIKVHFYLYHQIIMIHHMVLQLVFILLLYHLLQNSKQDLLCFKQVVLHLFFIYIKIYDNVPHFLHFLIIFVNLQSILIPYI